MVTDPGFLEQFLREPAAAALAIGLVRIPVKWNTPTTGLVIGTVFTFLLVWGVAAPFMGKRRR